MSRRLPDSLYAALEQRLRLIPLAALRSGYGALSREYRGLTVSGEMLDDLGPLPGPPTGRQPGGVPPAQARSLGYMAARFPATYAALASALDQVPDLALAGCATVLDVGAGPGTATWALRERLPGLRHSDLLESDESMLAHARALSCAYPDLDISVHSGDLVEQLERSTGADLVLMGYVLSELEAGNQSKALRTAWEKAGRGVLLVEPGTPSAFRLILGARDLWTKLGGQVVAPCPQTGPCPMDPARTEPGQAAPWCHFKTRLERRGLHRAIKGGALGYEDEKYAWVFVSKNPGARPSAPFRLHADPKRVNRHLGLDVCDDQGRRRVLFYNRRETSAGLRQAARRLHWGDAWDPAQVPILPEEPSSGDDGN